MDKATEEMQTSFCEFFDVYKSPSYTGYSNLFSDLHLQSNNVWQKKNSIHTQAMLPGTSMLEFTSIDTPVPFSRAAKMTLLATSDHIMYPSLQWT